MKLFTFLTFLFCIVFFQPSTRKDETFNIENHQETLLSDENPNSTENNTVQLDTLTKTSEPFSLNNSLCFWKVTFLVVQGETYGDANLELINLKNKKSILRHLDVFSFDDAYYSHSFNRIHFESLNLDAYKDLNFDGFMDVMLFDKNASESAGMFYRSYIFNPKTNIFDYSETISGYELTLDENEKSVASYAKNGVGWNISNVLFFDKKGKINHSKQTIREVITIDTTRFLVTTFRKFKGQKVIEMKIDTSLFEGY